ncbi:DUF2946 family protein [Pseudomonas matsuisoli]|uniref:DUF2946 family protein n=1 Tax=Pseudomonas matsuisoli TaxID=1515666 RepID=UPI0016632CF1|nr:DUF2946 family protein [Pseudomonas matsuisoli]
MTTTAHQRRSVALLLLCVLVLDALFIGIGRGHASALALSGLQGGYCSAAGHVFSGVGIDSKEVGHKVTLAQCPLCASSGGLPIGGWRLEALGVAPDVIRAAPARALVIADDHWRSANPRASPGSIESLV